MFCQPVKEFEFNDATPAAILPRGFKKRFSEPFPNATSQTSLSRF